eukprot:1793671-Rhodomonas_salina.3
MGGKNTMNAVTRRGLVLAVVCLVGIGFADCFISTSLQLQTGSSALLRQSGMSLRRAQGAASRAVFPGRSARGCRCSIASGEMVETQEKTASRTAISPAEAKERLQKLQDADQDGDKWNKEEVTTVLDSMKDGENGIVWNSVPMLSGLDNYAQVSAVHFERAADVDAGHDQGGHAGPERR